MADFKHYIAPLVLSTILKDFFTSVIVESTILWNHWLRNYFVKLVDRGECKIIGTRLTLFGHWIVEFLHKCTCQICSLLAFGELASGGFFHRVQQTLKKKKNCWLEFWKMAFTARYMYCTALWKNAEEKLVQNLRTACPHGALCYDCYTQFLVGFMLLNL